MDFESLATTRLEILHLHGVEAGRQKDGFRQGGGHIVNSVIVYQFPAGECDTGAVVTSDGEDILTLLRDF